jgi:hypothetical protein
MENRFEDHSFAERSELKDVAERHYYEFQRANRGFKDKHEPATCIWLVK